MNRLWASCLILLIASVGLSKEKEVDPLAQVVGQAIHSFHSGDYQATFERTQLAITYGTEDPRAYYFRGLAFLATGEQDTARSYFQFGALLEVERIDVDAINLLDVEELEDVNRSLERIQGPARKILEEYRPRVRAMIRIARVYKEEQLAKFRREFRNQLTATRIQIEGIDGIQGRVVAIHGGKVRVVSVDEIDAGIRAIIGMPESEFERVSNISEGIDSETAFVSLAKQVEPYAHRYEARHIGRIVEEDLKLEYDPYQDVLTDARSAAQGRQRSANSQQLVFFPETPETSSERNWQLANQHEFLASLIGFNVSELQLRKASDAVSRLSIDQLSSQDKKWLRENFPKYGPFRDRFLSQREDEQRARLLALARMKAQERQNAQDAISKKSSDSHPVWGTAFAGGALLANSKAKKADKEGRSSDAIFWRGSRDIAIQASIANYFPDMSKNNVGLLQGVISGVLDGSPTAVGLAVLKASIEEVNPELAADIDAMQALYDIYKAAT